jgi:hypothetical protein
LLTAIVASCGSVDRMTRPPPVPLFRGSRLRLLHDSTQRSFEIRDTLENRSLLALPRVRLYEARRTDTGVELLGAFAEGASVEDEYRRVISGDYPAADLDGLVHALQTTFKPPGELPLTDEQEIASDPQRFSGKHVRTRGAWSRGFEVDSFSAASACLIDPPRAKELTGSWWVEVVGIWHTKAPGRRFGFGHLGVMPCKCEVLELHLLDRLGDPKRPRVPAAKRGIVAQGRTVDFETNVEGRWRVLVDGRPISMTHQTHERGLTGSGRQYDDKSPVTPVRWADIGGYLVSDDPLKVWPVRGRTQMTCCSSSQVTIYNTVIYGDTRLQLDFTADFTSVAILEDSYRDGST